MNFFSTAMSVVTGVGHGFADYSRKMKDINAQAEKNLSSSFGNSSTASDAGRVATEMDRLKNERQVSLRNSIRANLKL